MKKTSAPLPDAIAGANEAWTDTEETQTPASSLTSAPDFAFLALGESHQLLHILGPARVLAQWGYRVTVWVSTPWHERMVERHAPELLKQVRRLRSLRLPGTGDFIGSVPNRIATLLLNLDQLISSDVIVTPERTSTWLRRLGAFRGILVHIPHGAGDREQSFDRRIRWFDLVITAGEKDRRMLIEQDLVNERDCFAGGYSKFDLVGGSPPRFFTDDRPIVLYNPHFDPDLSSWPAWGEPLLRAFSATPAFNFIVAPHIRAAGGMRRSLERAARQSAAPNIRFDLGSLHSINMDYTRVASLYLGDVSSQVYEFLRQPRPCVFLNPGGVNWASDPYYRHWHYGPVAAAVNEAMELIHRGAETHAQFGAAQAEGYRAAITSVPGPVSEHIAQIMLEQVGRRRQNGTRSKPSLKWPSTFSMRRRPHGPG